MHRMILIGAFCACSKALFAHVPRHVLRMFQGTFCACSKALFRFSLDMAQMSFHIHPTYSDIILVLTFEQARFTICDKNILQDGLSEPEFYGNLVYKFRKTVSKTDFSEKLKKIVTRFKNSLQHGYSAANCMHCC